MKPRAWYWCKVYHKWTEIIPCYPAFVMAYKLTKHAICLTKEPYNEQSK